MSLNTLLARLTFLLLAIVLPYSVFSQKSSLLPGYYINTAGDSISGTINYNYFNYDILIFRRDGGSKWAEIKADQI